mmetsp:Transcript_21853/g.47652  ORF Transcript_21853/g.47652 Transcript_21853/m.47652 type:complete len:162 (+) Transcript_21853:500-985(+)
MAEGDDVRLVAARMVQKVGMGLCTVNGMEVGDDARLKVALDLQEEVPCTVFPMVVVDVVKTTVVPRLLLAPHCFAFPMVVASAVNLRLAAPKQLKDLQICVNLTEEEEDVNTRHVLEVQKAQRAFVLVTGVGEDVNSVAVASLPKAKRCYAKRTVGVVVVM